VVTDECGNLTQEVCTVSVFEGWIAGRELPTDVSQARSA